ncbi:MAG: hypothetical protein EOM24_21100 [Chloroflexia bacterium]|nr:hypothetical protein [Chloroflexia bacterium]
MVINTLAGVQQIDTTYWEAAANYSFDAEAQRGFDAKAQRRKGLKEAWVTLRLCVNLMCNAAARRNS